MVYSGKPSTGCRNCRQRHIKCDETRPHCRACTRTGRSCPGYLHPFDVILRDQTSMFMKPAGPSDSSPISSDKSLQSSAESDESISEETKALSTFRSCSPARPNKAVASWPPPLGPVDLYQPMEETIVSLFFNSYLYLPKGPHIRNGFMEVLPVMFSNTRPGSYLHISTLAVAFFTVAAWTGQAALVRGSERYFIKALPKIRDALRMNDDSEFDDILVSILLLSTYEEFMAIKDWELPLKAHLRGAIALINAKRAKKLPEAKYPTIYNAVESQIIKATRGLDNPMVPAPQVWPLFQCTNTNPSPRVLLSSATSELVNLRHAWELMMASPAQETEATTIFAKANEIDIKLVSWSYRVPEHWMPVPATIIPQTVRNAGLWRGRCDCYSDMWIAVTWNTYRDCRILLQSIMLSCLRILSSQDSDGRRVSSLQKTIREIADDICATVPFFLGSQVESIRMKFGLVEYPFTETKPVTLTHKQSAPLMGAWHVFPYLRNLQNAELGLPLEQRGWLKEQMERILAIYFQR